ncbi:MAG: hypothetical protein HQK61_08985 [Desulfamplus sp.]|nr:hypothetical protein [Desulfamplus sp.]
MNINSYASYSNPLSNPYSPTSSNAVANEMLSKVSPSQEIPKQASQAPLSTDNDFSVNISQEAIRNSSNVVQPTETLSETLETALTEQTQQTQQVQQETQTEQTQQYQRVQREQQTQQMQSQFYQSPYAGQIPVSRASIDLMA